MLFNSFQYWIFFFIVAALFYSVPFRFGKILLLLASYVFYMWWDPRFIVLILTSTIVDYYLGIFLETATGRRKKLLLVVSLVVNLGILGFFKYYDFFAGSLAGLLRLPPSSVVLQIVLPVGISFYTFASLSYTFDVYWGKDEGRQKPDRLRAVHCIFSSSDCRSDHSCPAIHLSDLVMAYTVSDRDPEWNHPRRSRSDKEDGIRGSVRCGVRFVPSTTPRPTRVGWLRGRAVFLLPCKCFSIFLVTRISLVVAPSCLVSSFRLISRAHSWPETRLTSGKGGI